MPFGFAQAKPAVRGPWLKISMIAKQAAERKGDYGEFEEPSEI
jgi:hypothetical protein